MRLNGFIGHGIQSRPNNDNRYHGWRVPQNTTVVQPRLFSADRVVLGQVSFGRVKRGESAKKAVSKVEVVFEKNFLERLVNLAKQRQMNIGDYIQHALPYLTVDAPDKKITEQVSDTLTGLHHGKRVKTKVTTLFGSEQIFDEWIRILKATEKYAQISMYNFENILVPGGREVAGADLSPGWLKQQQILKLIEEKARKGVRFQILLDNSVVRERDEFNNPIFPRRMTNDEMIQHLRRLKEEQGLPIDVLEFPRKVAHIYHVKLLVSDGKRALLGGMNLSNHSAANWDACVSLEGAEVANLQSETFHPDWLMAKHRKYPDIELSELTQELPQIDPVTDPALKVYNTRPREYMEVGFQGKEGIGDFFKQKLASEDLKAIHSEQFIATHKELKELIVKRFREGVNIKMLHSSSVVDQFPYSRKAVFDLMREGLPVRFYNEWEAIGEKLHAKWTVFNDDEVLIGSANLSARGLETNLEQGMREDYPNYPTQRYTRGNRDMAVVIPSKKIAAAFLKQFKLDWDHSPPQQPPGYGEFEAAHKHPAYADLVKKIMGETK